MGEKLYHASIAERFPFPPRIACTDDFPFSLKPDRLNVPERLTHGKRMPSAFKLLHNFSLIEKTGLGLHGLWIPRGKAGQGKRVFKGHLEIEDAGEDLLNRGDNERPSR
jgi:hypothetical protein